MDSLQDDYELNLATTPSPDEISAKNEQLQEILDKLVALLMLQSEKSPKHGLATLLRMFEVRGKEFQEELNLGHDATNTARKIIAWTLADTMEVSTVIETINKAKACCNTDLPLIIHSDRGSQYISNAWREATEKMQQSYSHSGYPYDNACIESFHSLIK